MFAPSSGTLRDVFFFPSGGTRLYASLSAAPDPVRFGVVVVPSIGLEAAQSLDPAHWLASAAAAWGGAGLVLHPPGTLDSSGDPADLTLDAFSGAVRDAAGALRARVQVDELCLIGFRFGAAAVAMAAGELDPATVVLLGPTRDPAAAVQELRRASARGTFERGPATEAFGHTLPVALVGPGAAGRISDAMAGIGGRLAVVDFAGPPPPEGDPADAERLIVAGAMSQLRVRWATHLARSAEPVLRRRLGVAT